jgi:hypothetical protein
VEIADASSANEAAVCLIDMCSSYRYRLLLIIAAT